MYKKDTLYCNNKTIITKDIAERVLCLPIFPDLDIGNISLIVQIIKGK